MTPRRPRPRSRVELPAHIGAVAGALFQSRGFARVTMERVAAQAGVSKRTLYKYFPAKESLLERMLEDALAADLEARQFGLRGRAGFRANVNALLQESARWCGQHAEILLPYIRYKFASFDPGAIPAEDRGLLPVWRMLIDGAQAHGELVRNRSSEQLGVYFHYLYLGALMRWLTNPGLDLREEFDAIMALFMDGAARQGPARPAGRKAKRPRRG